MDQSSQPGQSGVVATLFYSPPRPKTQQPNATTHISTDALSPASVAPTSQDGAHISQSCIANFYKTLSAIVPEFSHTSVAERPLDNASSPRVMEIQFSLPDTDSTWPETLRKHEAISRFEHTWNIEAVFQNVGIYSLHKQPGLAVFDMDSTLIQQEVIDEIARFLGVEAAVSAITARAMNGELDFEASLRARCALLAGVPSSVFEKIRALITPTPGALELVRALKKLGYKTAVLSGGFTPVTGWFAAQIGLDYAFANHLGEIVHAERKRAHVLEIAKKEGIELERVLVVGDGANDLPMMGVAGLGVAFHAKPRVQMMAPARLNTESLLDVLYLFGFTREEQEELLR
ncbi:Phosphoserine phosphatase [Coniosporium tulheliwenetii]|uniref:Phosphoserine phosphatase n=1 Tax=Coniosporium tulheliwenetii TaxID=3383036 RepID=A0ACC2Z0B2_9PEZI|nr:Phosphoserine phosphatase [Cladosporium sp. JES 115]